MAIPMLRSLLSRAVAGANIGNFEQPEGDGGFMKNCTRLIIAVFLFTLVPIALFAQGTTGTLTGQVKQAGNALPGVTVTITSPQMQGTRTTTTNENGEYNFAPIPPGDYTAAFNLEGMNAVTRKVNVPVLQTARV